MSLSRALTVITVFAVFVLIVWAFLFKVSDADVWWHIKAGQTMLEQGWLIRIDPFAHTRAGLPYLATHEWFSQIIVAMIFKIGGPTGLILLRIGLALVTAVILLLIDRHHLWPNVLLAGAALLVTRQYFIERPQLFSNVLFALCLFLCLRLLDIPREETQARKRILIGLLVTTIVWANIHGGAALLSPLLLGTVFAQELFDAWRHRRLRNAEERSHLLNMLLWCVLLVCTLLATPNFHHNITYLQLLFTDRTAGFIREWQPRAAGEYLLWIGPFWIIALAALARARAKPIVMLLLLLGTGLLSRTGARHEVLFVLTALACTFYELREEEWVERLRERLTIALPVTAVAVLLLLALNLPFHAFFLRRNLAGFGAFSPTAGAVDFLERSAITDPIFNTYTSGGYLLYRGHKVFLDGRNIDYGYDFLKSALDARYNRTLFNELADKYGTTVAVIERHTEEGKEDTAFAFLVDDPHWTLVFLDDWSAVYLRRSAATDPVIAMHRYALLHPQFLDRGVLSDQLTQREIGLLQVELERAVREDQYGMRAHILLAKLHRGLGRFEQANALAKEAAKRWPYRYEPEEILATVAAVQERWNDSAAHFERVLALSKHLSIAPPYDQLAIVFANAGERDRAEEFRRKAMSSPRR